MRENEFMNLKENKKHGDFLLPFIVYNTFIPNCFSIFPMHWHDEMEIIKIVKKYSNFIKYINILKFDDSEIKNVFIMV